MIPFYDNKQNKTNIPMMTGTVTGQSESSKAVWYLQNGAIKACSVAAQALFGNDDLTKMISLSPIDFSPVQQPDGSSSYETMQNYLSEVMRCGVKRFKWQHIRENGAVFETEVELTLITIREKKMVKYAFFNQFQPHDARVAAASRSWASSKPNRVACY